MQRTGTEQDSERDHLGSMIGHMRQVCLDIGADSGRLRRCRADSLGDSVTEIGDDGERDLRHQLGAILEVIRDHSGAAQPTTPHDGRERSPVVSDLGERADGRFDDLGPTAACPVRQFYSHE